MLKRIIIVATILLVPTAFYVASRYGELESVTFEQAIARSADASDEDQAPKQIVTSSIVGTDGNYYVCEDRSGKQFNVQYTGEPPSIKLLPGATVDFLGHVHTGETPYFHATQVYQR